MKSYTIIPHVADVRLKTEAKTLEELFVFALEGMNKIMYENYDEKLDEHTLVREISISSFDTTSLLIDFLSEILTLSQLEKTIFYEVKFLSFEENRLLAHVIGAKVDKFTKDIKAVTYHEAEVKKNQKGKWETVLVFDI